jgi:transposase
VDHIGIDLHKRESQIYVLGDTGEVTECRVATSRDRLTAVLGARPPAKVLLEAATESEWVATCLEGLGHEVIVADPNYAPMYCRGTGTGARRACGRPGADDQRHVSASARPSQASSRAAGNGSGSGGRTVSRDGVRRRGQD